MNTAEGFATNISAYCGRSGTTKTGSSGYAYLLGAVAVGSYLTHAHLTEAHKTMVGPVAGLRLTIALNRRGTLTATTLAVLPKPGRACFITYTSAHPSSSAAVLAAVQPKIDAVVREEPRLRAGQLRLYSYRRFG